MVSVRAIANSVGVRLVAEDLENDFKQIKVSRLTLGLIMSVAVTSGIIVWNAAQVASRIGELEDTVNRVEQDMGDLTLETDPTILIRLDSLEKKIDELADMEGLDEIDERLGYIETWIEELDRDSGEEFRWEIDDLHHRSFSLEQAIRSRPWGDDFLRDYLGW
jgi:transcriptional regulator with XRE-family HTH domain